MPCWCVAGAAGRASSSLPCLVRWDRCCFDGFCFPGIVQFFLVVATMMILDQRRGVWGHGDGLMWFFDKGAARSEFGRDRW